MTVRLWRRSGYEQIAKPFEWTLARRDLERQLARLDSVAAEPVAVKAA